MYKVFPLKTDEFTKDSVTLTSNEDMEKALCFALNQPDNVHELLRFFNSLDEFKFNYLTDKTKTIIDIHSKNEDWISISFYLSQIQKPKILREKFNITIQILDLFKKQLPLNTGLGDINLSYLSLQNDLNMIPSHSLNERLTQMIDYLSGISHEDKFGIRFPLPDLSVCLLSKSHNFDLFNQKFQKLEQYLYDFELRNFAPESNFNYIGYYQSKNNASAFLYLLQLILLMNDHLEYVNHHLLQVSNQLQRDKQTSVSLLFYRPLQAQLKDKQDSLLEMLMRSKDKFLESFKCQPNLILEAKGNVFPALFWTFYIHKNESLSSKLEFFHNFSKIKFNQDILNDVFHQLTPTFDSKHQQQTTAHHLIIYLNDFFKLNSIESQTFYRTNQMVLLLEKANHALSHLRENFQKFRISSDFKIAHATKEKLLKKILELHQTVQFYQDVLMAWSAIDNDSFSKDVEPEKLKHFLKSSAFIDKNNRLMIEENDYADFLSKPKLEYTESQKDELASVFRNLTYFKLDDLQKLKAYQQYNIETIIAIRNSMYIHPSTKLIPEILICLDQVLDTPQISSISVRKILDYLNILFEINLDLTQVLSKLNLSSKLSIYEFTNKVLDLIKSASSFSSISSDDLKLIDKITKLNHTKHLTQMMDLSTIYDQGLSDERQQIIDKHLQKNIDDLFAHEASEKPASSSKVKKKKSKKSAKDKKKNGGVFDITSSRNEQFITTFFDVFRRHIQRELRSGFDAFKVNLADIKHIESTHEQHIAILKKVFSEFKKNMRHQIKKRERKEKKSNELNEHIESMSDTSSALVLDSYFDYFFDEHFELIQYQFKLSSIKQRLLSFGTDVDLNLSFQKLDQFMCFFSDLHLNQTASEKTFQEIFYNFEPGIMQLQYRDRTYLNKLQHLIDQMMFHSNFLSDLSLSPMAMTHHFHLLLVFIKETSLLSNEFKHDQPIYPDLRGSVQKNYNVAHLLSAQFYGLAQDPSRSDYWPIFTYWYQVLASHAQLIHQISSEFDCTHSKQLLYDLDQTNRKFYVFICESKQFLSKVI